MEKNIERIRTKESQLDRCKEIVSDVEAVLAELERSRDEMISLFRYYGSQEWYEDREVDLPEDVKAGVLSEDEVYDVITHLRDEAFRMLESATDILKNRI